MTTTGRRGERGMSISVELAILLPALVVIIALLVWRLSAADKRTALCAAGGCR